MGVGYKSQRQAGDEQCSLHGISHG
jgi:hypothetical protein